MTRIATYTLPFFLVTVIALGDEPKKSGASEEFLTAAALQNRGLYKLAISHWKEAIAAEKDEQRLRDARMYLSMCYFANRQYSETVALAKTLLKEPAHRRRPQPARPPHQSHLPGRQQPPSEESGRSCRRPQATQETVSRQRRCGRRPRQGAAKSRRRVRFA